MAGADGARGAAEAWPAGRKRAAGVEDQVTSAGRGALGGLGQMAPKCGRT